MDILYRFSFIKILTDILFLLQRHLLVERSFSEGESGGRTMYRCKQCGGLQTVPSFPVENQLRVFPNLTDARLQEFGIANSTDVEIDSK